MSQTPRRNLPPDADRWGRHVDTALRTLNNIADTTVRTNSSRTETLSQQVNKINESLNTIFSREVVEVGTLLRQDDGQGTVAVPGFTMMTVPALPDIYEEGEDVFVLMGYTGPLLILRAVTYVDPTANPIPTYEVMDLVSINTGRLTAVVEGEEERLTLPIVPGTYTNAESVYVLLSENEPSLVIGGATFTTPPEPNPEVPSKVATPKATNITTSSATISWSAPSNNGAPILEYEVRFYRATGDAWQTHKQAGRSRTYSGLTAGAKYRARVRARNSAGWGPFSNYVNFAAKSNLVTRTVTIKPTWSGTYRAGSGWDRWNTNRYGGRSDLYQGSGYGSGRLTGLAVYGNQIVNLKAKEIKSITVQLKQNNGVYNPNSARYDVRGSAHGSAPGGAPSVRGETATGPTLGKNQSGVVKLTKAMREEFRTGTIKGLALVGSSYGAVRGTSYGTGMTLSISYTVEE